MAHSDAEVRSMAAMWAHTVVVQAERLDAAVDAARATQLDPSRVGIPLTPNIAWVMGAERYFCLLALAQVRKCVRLLPDDGLPEVGDEKMIRLLRDVDEHWEQGEDDPKARSLRELREIFPEAAPGTMYFDTKRTWLGNVDLDEIVEWVLRVEEAVRERAADAGEPIPAVAREMWVSRTIQGFARLYGTDPEGAKRARGK